jgi:hypothetical protein
LIILCTIGFKNNSSLNALPFLYVARDKRGKLRTVCIEPVYVFRFMLRITETNFVLYVVPKNDSGYLRKYVTSRLHVTGVVCSVEAATVVFYTLIPAFKPYYD